MITLCVCTPHHPACIIPQDPALSHICCIPRHVEEPRPPLRERERGREREGERGREREGGTERERQRQRVRDRETKTETERAC